MGSDNHKNYIFAEINLKEYDLDKVKIINSFENVKRINKWKDKEEDYKYENEEELKKNSNQNR